MIKKEIAEKLFKAELKQERLELNKVEDLLKSLRKSGNYDVADELAKLNRFAEGLENDIRKKQQKLDQAEKEASKYRQISKEMGFDRELNILNDIDSDIKLQRNNLIKTLRIVKQAQTSL